MGCTHKTNIGKLAEIIKKAVETTELLPSWCIEISCSLDRLTNPIEFSDDATMKIVRGYESYDEALRLAKEVLSLEHLVMTMTGMGNPCISRVDELDDIKSFDYGVHAIIEGGLEGACQIYAKITEVSPEERKRILLEELSSAFSNDPVLTLLESIQAEKAFRQE